jgi:DNA-binding response OmpR family regulator
MCKNPPTVLFVEHRDEVFARLAADLADVGLGVRRAETAADASRLHARQPADVLMINARLPDESGWLLTRKLRMAEPELPIWIYTDHSTEADVAMANFVAADELIDYHGNVWRLTEEISHRLRGGPVATAQGETQDALASAVG